MLLSERELISLIKRKLESSSPSREIIVGPGDDAAVIAHPSGEALVISTDALVEDVHFSLRWASGFLLGQKSFLSSVSDIFAMGARPHACLVSLGLPLNIEPSFVEDLYDGMLKQANRLGASIVGGNISRSEKLFIDMTVTGVVHPEAVVTRAGASVGDSIYVTGELGGAALASKCLLKGRIDRSMVMRAESVFRGVSAGTQSEGDDAAVVELLARFFVPKIRAEEARLLSEARICTSMIDISDGIGSDLSQICFESGVGALIEIDSIPVFDRIPAIAMRGGFDLRELAICGGEDYELLFTVGFGEEARLHRLFDANALCRITKIGRILPKSKGLVYVDCNGERIESFAGFDHFAGKADRRNG